MTEARARPTPTAILVKCILSKYLTLGYKEWDYVMVGSAPVNSKGKLYYQRALAALSRRDFLEKARGLCHGLTVHLAGDSSDLRRISEETAA